MSAEDFRYSAQFKIDDSWHWSLESNELWDAKRHIRRRIDKNPGLSGRIVDKSTGKTVFIDPDPDALKIRFRKDESSDWESLELEYVDKESRWLNVRDGSDIGVWLTVDQVHPDDRETVKEFGEDLERAEYTEDQIRAFGEAYEFIRERAAYLRSKMNQE